MWLNENAGIIALVVGVITVVLLGIVLWLVFSLRSRFAVQRLKFVGLYATDMDTRRAYASLTIGNRSVSEIAIKEIGVKNGGIAFDLTRLYRSKEQLDDRARIVIEQRHSIDFTLTLEELQSILVDGKKGKQLKTLRLYAIDLMGNLYQGKIGAVRKLLAAHLAGKTLPPAPMGSVPVSPVAATKKGEEGDEHTAVEAAPAVEQVTEVPATERAAGTEESREEDAVEA